VLQKCFARFAFNPCALDNLRRTEPSNPVASKRFWFEPWGLKANVDVKTQARGAVASIDFGGILCEGFAPWCSTFFKGMNPVAFEISAFEPWALKIFRQTEPSNPAVSKRFWFEPWSLAANLDMKTQA